MSYHLVLWRGLLIDVDSRDSTLRTVLSRTKYAVMARIRRNERFPVWIYWLGESGYTQKHIIFNVRASASNMKSLLSISPLVLF